MNSKIVVIIKLMALQVAGQQPQGGVQGLEAQQPQEGVQGLEAQQPQEGVQGLALLVPEQVIN